MKAIILAAGKGSRLNSLTKNKPKCLVSLFGKTILEWQLEAFQKCGISDITVVRGYKGQMINFKNLTYFDNLDFASTNMVETLFCAKEKFHDSVIVSYGDIIFQSTILKKLINSVYDTSIVVDNNWKTYWEKRFENPLDDAESLSIDESDNISSIGQKISNIDEICGQYIGLMKFQGNAINDLLSIYDNLNEKYLRQNQISDFKNWYMTDFLQYFIKSGFKIKPIRIDGGWLELDTIKDYELYNNLYKNNTLTDFIDLKL